MSKLQKILTAVFAAIAIVLVVVIAVRHNVKANGGFSLFKAKTESANKAEATSAKADADDNNSAITAKTDKTDEANSADTAALDADMATAAAADATASTEAMTLVADTSTDAAITLTAADLENAPVETEELYVSMAGVKPEGASGEDGYIEDVTSEDVEIFNNAFPAITTGTANTIIANYNSQFGYEKWANGDYKIPFKNRSFTENDFARQKSAQWAGLSEEAINDAIDFIFDNLSEDDIKKLLKLTFGKSIDLDHPEQIKLELFQSWLENPVLFEAWLYFIQDLKVGESGTLSENCPGVREYLAENQAAREPGRPGLAIRVRDAKGNTGFNLDNSGEYYVTQGHIMAVCQVISFFEPLEIGAGRYHVSRRMHLISLDYNHLRVATETHEDEPDLDYWLTFSYYLKGGKKAFFVGANLADREPGEIKNTSTVSKKTIKPKPAPVVTKKQDVVTQTLIPVYGNYSAPTPEVNNPTTPSSPTPDPAPKPESNEKKSPAADPGAQGNAPTNGGPKSDPGPGEWKEDQGNSQSPNVPDSQYQPGNSTNPDGGNDQNYDSGPSADGTDGGSAPATDPIPVHNSDNAGDTGNNNGAMTGAPPAVDD